MTLSSRKAFGPQNAAAAHSFFFRNERGAVLEIVRAREHEEVNRVTPAVPRCDAWR